jgi:hypothetical protein
MDKIDEIKALQVLDSRGNPTLKVIVKTKKYAGYAIVPSGASTGVHEALELRDKKKEYHGMGVEKAVDNVNKKINKALKGMSVTAQEEIDLAGKSLGVHVPESIWKLLKALDNCAVTHIKVFFLRNLDCYHLIKTLLRRVYIIFCYYILTVSFK